MLTYFPFSTKKSLKDKNTQSIQAYPLYIGKTVAVCKHLKSLFATIEKRWNRGIEHFLYLKEHPPKPGRSIYCKTAIYGDIEVSHPVEKIFLDSIFVQRLKNISHLTFAYHAYPEARHSRFEHSLGVYFLSNQVTKSMGLTKKDREKVAVAGLLHDIGHGPYSHFTDMVFKNGLDRDKRKESGMKYHEKRGRDLVLSRKQKNEPTFSKLDILNPKLSDFLQDSQLDPAFIAHSITGEEENALSQLINGPADLDKIDYLLRDSYNSGVPFGTVDYYRLARMYRLGRGKKTNRRVLGVEGNALLTFIHLLISREIHYSAIAFHHVSIISSTMLLCATEIALDLIGRREKGTLLAYLEIMDDADLTATLEAMSTCGCYGSDPKLETLGMLIRNLKRRRLYKRIWHMRFCDFTTTKLYEKIEDLEDQTIYFTGDELQQISKPLGQKIKKEKQIIILNVQKIDKYKDPELNVIKDGHAFTIKEYTEDFLGGTNSKIKDRYGVQNTEYGNIFQRLKFDNWSAFLVGPEEVKCDWKNDYLEDILDMGRKKIARRITTT